MSSPSPWVVDVTAASFEKTVIERSAELPVVVDFWAAWCGPCRQLGPVLETLADEYAGKFLLAKVDVDQQPELAGAFAVQSIPHVVAIRDRVLVDEFRGALPEPILRQWLDRLLPSPAEQLLKEAESLEPRDPPGAESRLRQALAVDERFDPARIALARVLLSQRRLEEARTLVAQLEGRGFLEPDAERVKSQLDIALAAAESGGVEQARRAVEAHPHDLSLRLPLADALASAGQHAEALELCLSVIQQDRSGVGVQAKETMLDILNLLDPASDLASEYRRKLASALY